MTYEKSLEITLGVLKRHVDRPEGITAQNHIQNDLGLDSLGVMEVVADLEDELDVQIPTDTLSGISTVDDVAKAIAKVSAKSS
jgi:acyl carrier protein